MSLPRTRWAAIGAAVAVTLGAGGIGITHATTSSGERPVYVPIEPCRLADTRPAPNKVGPRSAPLGPSETYDIDGWGVVGNCSLPNGTSALALNVTAVGATQQTNLRFFPQSGALPTTANLNPTPGAPPTPNAVNVTVNGSNGEFSVYNRFGSVAVVIDVMGYYDHHTHDDRYYTRAQTDTRIAGKADTGNVYTRAQIDQQLASVDAESLGGSPASDYPRFRAIIKMRSGYNGYTVEQGTDPGISVTASGSGVLEVGDIDSPARTMMESATCTAGFSSGNWFSVFKDLEIGTPPVSARLYLIRPSGSVLTSAGLALYCTIWW